MKYTFTFEGDTRSYNDEASKTIVFSFENPASQKVILDEFVNFLKATGEYLTADAQLEIVDSPKNLGVKINFPEDKFGINANEVYNHLNKTKFVGPDEC